MFNSIIKSFAVMITGTFALGLLVNTAINANALTNTITITSETEKSTTIVNPTSPVSKAKINFVDNSTTKNLTLCVNGSFVTTGSEFNPGNQIVKVYFDSKSASTCDAIDLQKNKVFESSQLLSSGQTLTITAEGAASRATSTETIKPTLVSTSDLPGILSQNTVSWKNIANSNVKYKDAICMDGFLIKEDAPGSMKNKVIHGDTARNFSFDFTRNGAFCTPSATSAKLAIDIKCGCEGAKLYELGFEKVIVNVNTDITGLTFKTKIIDAPVVPVTPEVKPPTPPVTPVVDTPKVVTKPVTPPVVTPTPVASAPVVVKAPELAQAQTTTVRSGGSAVFLIALMSIALTSFAYLATKTKKIQIN
jgi:hypothetical protein